jgi:HPt (histidine-containing phosphotransfer) domain-containing protein
MGDRGKRTPLGLDVAEAQGKIRALGEQYRASLPQKVGELRGLAAAARADATALGAAVQLAHRLAGTAGSYGLYDVGELCQEIEALLERARGPAADWPAIDERLARLDHHSTTLR